MKLPLKPIFLASFIITLVLAWPILRDPHFPSQNAIYHAAMANLERTDSTDELTATFLSHRDHPEFWIDQHRGFHKVLGFFQNWFSPLHALHGLNVVGLFFVAFAFLLALKSVSHSWPKDARGDVFLSILALAVLFLNSEFLLRLSVGRPAAWSLSFFLFLFSFLPRFREGRHKVALALLLFLWSSFSYFAVLGGGLVVASEIRPRRKQSISSIQTVAIAALAILAGSLWSSGLGLLHHFPLLLANYPFAQSGVYEWSASAKLSFVLPLALCLAAVFLGHRHPPEESINRLTRQPLLPALAILFSFLTLRQQRWLEFAWPLSLLYALPIFASIAPARIQQLLPPWPWIKQKTLPLLSLGLFIFLNASLWDQVQNDQTLAPDALPVLNEVKSRLPQTPILTLDWTLFSPAFFLDRQSKIEPGFSLALYQQRDRGKFLVDYYLVTQTRSPREAYDRLSRLLRSIGARHVLFQQAQLPIHPYRPPPWMKVLYISGPWVLAEIDVEPTASPEQMRASFTISPEDVTDRLNVLCSMNPIAVRALSSFSDLSANQAEPLTYAPPINAKDPQTCVHDLRLQLEKSDLILWFDPQPAFSLDSFQGESVRGFFSLFKIRPDSPPATTATYEILADFPEPGLAEIPEYAAQLAAADSSSWRRARRTVLSLDRHPNDQQKPRLRRGRFTQVIAPKGTDLCWAYQSAASAMLRHQEELFRAWKEGPADIDSLRAELALESLCQHPALIPATVKPSWLNTCLRFQENLEAPKSSGLSFPGQSSSVQSFSGPSFSGQWSRRLVADLTLLKMGRPSRLTDFRPTTIWNHGFFSSSIATDFVPPDQFIFGQGNLPIFTSGHLAAWWTRVWLAKHQQGQPILNEDQQDFVLFAKDSYRWWKGPFEHNLFLTRWWSEALVNALSLPDTRQNPFLSDWLKELFLATETYIQGPLQEPFPGCLGPQVPGLGVLPSPNHNAAVIWEGLEQARRLDLTWWNSDHEKTLQGLMNCTLSLQKNWPYWPPSQEGEFALSPGLGEFHADVQAHAMNAIATRIQNDGIQCNN